MNEKEQIKKDIEAINGLLTKKSEIIAKRASARFDIDQDRAIAKCAEYSEQIKILRNTINRRCEEFCSKWETTLSEVQVLREYLDYEDYEGAFFNLCKMLEAGEIDL